MALLSQTMGEIGEIIFRSGLFDEKHMLEAVSYLSFAGCGFGGLPCHGATLPNYASQCGNKFLTRNTWMASVSSTAKKTLLVLWKPPNACCFYCPLAGDLVMDVCSDRLTHVHTEMNGDDARVYF